MTDRELLETILQKFTGMEEKFTGVEGKIAGLEERFTGLEERFVGMEERFTGLEEKFAGMEERFVGVEERLAGLEEKVAGQDERFTDIEARLIGMESRQELFSNKLSMVSSKCDVTKRKVEDLTIYVKWSGNEMSKRINKLQDAMDTVIAVLQQEDVLPATAQ